MCASRTFAQVSEKFAPAACQATHSRVKYHRSSSIGRRHSAGESSREEHKARRRLRNRSGHEEKTTTGRTEKTRTERRSATRDGHAAIGGVIFSAARGYPGGLKEEKV
jgi:hypothetical protein